MPLPMIGTSFAPNWSSPALGAFGVLPDPKPLIMGGGDWFSVGARDKSKLTDPQIASWNAWLKRIGMPENTFSQFSINPKTGQYALKNVQQPLTPVQAYHNAVDPQHPVQGQFGFGQYQKLAPAPSTNAPISTTPTVTRSQITLPATTTALPSYNATVPAVKPVTPTPVAPPTGYRQQRFTPERDYQPFPIYNRISRFAR